MAIGGGGTFTSDQTTLQKDTGSISLLRAGRARVTSIQGKGVASSVLKIHDCATTGAAAAGNLVATYHYGTEGLEVYVPGAGILCKDGIVYHLTGTSGSVTVTITGA